MRTASLTLLASAIFFFAACSGTKKNFDAAQGTPDLVIKNYPAGQRAEERLYLHGRRVGTHTGWWSNGSLKFRYRYVDDEMDGLAEEWYPDGRPYRRMQYAMGHEAGLQTMWKADGTLKANYEVRDGRKYGLTGVKDCINVKDDVPSQE